MCVWIKETIIKYTVNTQYKNISCQGISKLKDLIVFYTDKKNCLKNGESDCQDQITDAHEKTYHIIVNQNLDESIVYTSGRNGIMQTQELIGKGRV